MPTVIQVELDKIGTQIIAAAYDGDLKRVEELNLAAKAMQSFTEILHTTTPTPKIQSTRVEKEKRGRKVYSESDVIAFGAPQLLTMNYRAFSKDGSGELEPVKFEHLGIVRSYKNKSFMVLTAMRALETVQDLTEGCIYGFQNVSPID